MSAEKIIASFLAFTQGVDYSENKYVTYLLNGGDQCAELTGGWTARAMGNYSDAKIDGSGIYIKGGSFGGGIIGESYCTTNIDIDVGEYKKLCIDITFAFKSTWDRNRVKVYSGANQSSYGSRFAYFECGDLKDGIFNRTVEFDISESYYIRPCVYACWTMTEVTLNKAWIEK